MLNDILGVLNWISLVVLFASGAMTYSYFNSKKMPKLISAASALLAFVATFLILFMLYRSISFPLWMRWPNELLATQKHSTIFEKPGHYRINLSGWQHNTIPSGDVFTCSDCDSHIQVQIVYGIELEPNSKFKSNSEFISHISQPETQKEISDSVLRSSIYPSQGVNISIKRTDITKIGGLDALQYSAIVEIPPTVTHETSMVAIHNNRIMKISLNFYDGAMNDKAAKKVNTLFSSLLFL